MVRVAFDAMGGDHGAAEVVPGVIDYARAHPDVELILVGDTATIRQVGGELPANVRIVHAGSVIEMDEHPALAMREKKDASILVAAELVRKGEADAVVIATPNFTHYEVLCAALAAGKHVLVEKPLCTDVDDCRRVVDLAERHRGLLWVGMEYRYMRPVARLVEEVHGGAVGRLRMLAIREHRFPFLRKVGDWNRFNRYTGGTLVEKCCHFFDLMNLIARQRPQ